MSTKKQLTTADFRGLVRAMNRYRPEIEKNAKEICEHADVVEVHDPILASHLRAEAAAKLAIYAHVAHQSEAN